jgi:hypothetical protein
MLIFYYDCLMPGLSRAIILFFFWPYYNIYVLNWGPQLRPQNASFKTYFWTSPILHYSSLGAAHDGELHPE